jgi:spore coat polysaccharide biosynthesis protein SpsF
MRTVACVQARMASSRLPGKAMLELDGKPIIGHVLDRTNDAKLVNEVVLATTWGEEDDVLAAYAKDHGYRSYAGSQQDVLKRIRDAAEFAEAEIVVRVTGDCPMLEPDVIDKVVGALGNYDFASNCIKRTYPKGLDCEAMWMDTLQRMDRLATSSKARGSVTWFCYREHPELFRLRSVELPAWEANPGLNLCVDTQEDLERLRAFSEMPIK